MEGTNDVLAGFHYIAQHMEEYYDKLMTGEVDWIQLLEETNIPGAVDILRLKEDLRNE